MGSNVRFIGFVNEKLRDMVDLAGKDAIYLDCKLNDSIFKLLMSLGAELRFKDNDNLSYIIERLGLINVNKVYTDSTGKQHYDISVQDGVTAGYTTVIVDFDRLAITGVSGNTRALVNLISSYDYPEERRAWTMYLENVPIIFGTLPMEEAVLHRAGVFGTVPKHYKYNTQIKVPDGTTPWSNLPTVKYYVDGNGHRHMLDDKKEE